MIEVVSDEVRAVVESVWPGRPECLRFRLGGHGRNALRFPNQWARKHLRSGDLAVLFRISKREWVNAEPDQIERLMRRSFVKKEADGSPRPTAKGRLVLWIKRLSGS